LSWLEIISSQLFLSDNEVMVEVVNRPYEKSKRRSSIERGIDSWLPLASVAGVAELYRDADGELPQKAVRVCDRGCFGCLPDSTNVKSGNSA
jgi:hypothetical protein